MATITLSIDDTQLEKLQQRLKRNEYTVKDPRKMVELLLQNECDHIDFFIFTTCMDDGGNNLCGDVLTDEQQAACGASCD